MSIVSVLKDFDKYVQQTLNKKQESGEPQNQFGKALNCYSEAMQKRMKIRTSGQHQKFEKLIRPMKKLKTFLSVKDFIQRIPKNYDLQSDIMNDDLKSQKNILKMEYQQLRGGYYMDKIQKHLKNCNINRTLDQKSLRLLRALEQQPVENSQYRKWMQNAISNVNPNKQQLLFSDCQLKNRKSLLSQEMNTLQYSGAPRRKLTARYSNIYKSQKNFSRVSDVLSARLKKILVDKYVGVSKRDTLADKKTSQIMKKCRGKSATPISNKPQTAKVGKRSHFASQAQNKQNGESNKWFHKRAQTSKQVRGNCVKKEYFSQINNILQMADQQVERDSEYSQIGVSFSRPKIRKQTLLR